MNLRLHLLLPLLLAAPVALAQSDPGDVDAFVGLPHAASFVAGETNTVQASVYAIAVCEPGMEAPEPLRVRVTSGIEGPDDGQGPAWLFLVTEWSFNWTSDGDDYAIDEDFAMEVEAAGHDPNGIAGEFAVSTVAAASQAGCSASGYTIPARGNHAHAQVGPRPPSEDKGSPGVPPALAGALVIGVAWAVRRRSP